MTYQDAQERATAYGVRMDEPLLPGDIDSIREGVDHSVLIDLDDPRLARVVRLRLIGYNSREYPRWDISYCWGELKPNSDIELKDGKRYVRVQIPFHNLNRFWEKQLIAWGREHKVYVKGLGLFDGDVVSKLYG